MKYSNTLSLEFSKVAHLLLIYIYISYIFNACHQFPLGCDIDWLPHLVRSSCSNYHSIMDILCWINASSFNGCVITPSGCLDG